MNTSRFCLAFFCLIGTACSEAPPSETSTTTAPISSRAVKGAPEAKATYRLLDASKNEDRSKLNANILLSKKIDESQIRELGVKIKDSISGYQKNYFFFYLHGMTVGSGAWATASFSPEEEIRILGATQAEEDSSKSKLRVDGKIIGKWYDEQRSASGLAFYEKNGKCFLKRVIKGGTPTITRFVRNGNILKPKEKTGFGEYFKMQDDGTLAFVNNEGKVFGQAFPIK